MFMSVLRKNANRLWVNLVERFLRQIFPSVGSVHIHTTPRHQNSIPPRTSSGLQGIQKSTL